MKITTDNETIAENKVLILYILDINLKDKAIIIKYVEGLVR